MKSKGGVKLLFAMLSVVGGALTLSSCIKNPSLGVNHNSGSGSIVNVEPGASSSTGAGSSVGNTNNSTTTSTNTSTSTSTSTDTSTTSDNPNHSTDYEAEIETLFKDKINNKLEQNYVSNVDAKYFVLNDSMEYGRNLETYGFVTLAKTGEVKPVMLAMPISYQDYQLFSSFNFETYNSNKDLKENYDASKLSYVYDAVSFGSTSFSYATLDGAEWDLNQLSSSKIERMLEEKYTNQIYNYFEENYNNTSLDSIDLKYCNIFDSTLYGKILKFYGSTISKQGTVLPLTITLGVSDSNYNSLSKLSLNNYDETKDLAENYSQEQLYNIYQIDISESTKTLEYTVGDSPYFVNKGYIDVL